MSNDMEISDYRDPQNLNIQLTNQQNETPQSKINKSYSNALSQNQLPKFPTKQQAILFSSIEGTKLQEYLLALGAIINPKNIIFSSRISNNRICIYLSNKEIVDKFMNDHGSIKINGEFIQARRLVTPAERLIMSNVCPTIPHEILEGQLKQLGLNLISPTTFLRIGATNPEYSHVLSFRRQIYISPPENITIPESIVISYDNTSYRIFLSQDRLSCFKCKQQGHIASQCHTENNTPLLRNTPEISTQSDHIASQYNTDTTDMTENNNPSTSTKRNISEVITPPIDISGQTSNEKDIFATPTPMKTKKSKPSSLTETSPTTKDCMAPAKKFIESESHSFALNYEQITDFFENAFGSPDPLSIAKNYTDDIPALLDMLTKIYPHLTQRSIKTRCTKIRKKIMKQINQEPPDYESDSSLETY